MKKRSTTNTSCIESTKMMLNFGGDPKPVIQGICATHVLTDDFIREFSNYIDTKMFSSSYKLTDAMADKHPDLFDESLFKDYFFNGINIFEEKEETTDEEDAVSVTKNFNNVFAERADCVDITMALRYIDDLINKQTNNNSELIRFLKSLIRSCEISELTAENCIGLMGFDNEVDSLLLKRVQDETIREQILLSLSLSDDSQNITASAYKYMGNDMKERSLGTENISFNEFIKVISQTNDIGWQRSMIEKAISNEIEILMTSESLDTAMLHLVTNMNENNFVKFTKLYKYAPNAFSYKIMNWALMNKYFNENDFIEMKDIFKSAGCLFQLKKIAKENNYTELAKVL